MEKGAYLYPCAGLVLDPSVDYCLTQPAVGSGWRRWRPISYLPRWPLPSCQQSAPLCFRPGSRRPADRARFGPRLDKHWSCSFLNSPPPPSHARLASLLAVTAGAKVQQAAQRESETAAEPNPSGGWLSCFMLLQTTCQATTSLAVPWAPFPGNFPIG